MSRPAVLVTCHHLLRHMDKFRTSFEERHVDLVLPEPKGQQFEVSDMLELFETCDVAICGDDPMPREVIANGKAHRLKTIIRWGIGTDSVDKVAAAELGVRVLNTPGVFSDEVADAAFALILMLTRGYHLMDRSVREGGWLKIEGRSLSGMTLGVIGLGSIGQGILRRAEAFGTTTIGFDPAEITPDVLAKTGTRQVPLDEVLAGSDILVVACNLTPDNHHMINDQTLKQMPRGSYLVNVGRGPLVDANALATALQAGHLAGAALDVFEEEPLPMDSPLRELDNCVFGTHNGSNTSEAVARVNQRTVDMALEEISLHTAAS